MAIGIILGIVLLAGVVVSGISIIREFNAFNNAEADYIRSFNRYRAPSDPKPVEPKLNKKKVIISLILCGVLFFSFILVPFSFHTVQSGQVAVVKHLGRAVNTRTAGTYFDFWITNTYMKYDAKVQDNFIETAAYSSDAQMMDIQMSLQYQILPDKAMAIANQYGGLDALDARITAIATEKVKSVLSSHKAMDIIANREAMSPAVEEVIRAAIGEEYFVTVVSVVLTNIDFSDAFELAVENKMIAEQNKLKADYENETILAKAEAEAQAKILQAEGEKKANELLEKSLTEKILQEMYLEKWNGQLPKVVSDGEMIMEIPNME